LPSLEQIFDVIPSSVPGLYYICRFVWRGILDRQIEVNVTNLSDPTKSFIWKRYLVELEWDDAFWIMGCVDGGQNLVLDSGQYQSMPLDFVAMLHTYLLTELYCLVSIRMGGPTTVWSDWMLVRNVTLAPAVNTSQPTAPTSAVLDEDKRSRLPCH